MNNLSIFWIILYTLALLLFAKILSLSKSQNNYKSQYLKKRNASIEILQKENRNMKALNNGEIKCHKLANTAPIYNVGKWVDEMSEFMKKPISLQLLKIEGSNTDGEN